jgi:chlorobactene lauroyltransferase
VRVAGLDGFALMDERQLRQFGFLRRLGALSVARDNPREALQSINYAADAIRATNNVLLVFPQGLTLPNDVRPLKFYNGLARIVERTGEVDLCALALRYDFLEAWRPFALARVGIFERVKVDENFDAKKLTQDLSATLTRTLDNLRDDVLRNELNDYVEIVAPRRAAKLGKK